jgi:hypothetical protein
MEQVWVIKSTSTYFSIDNKNLYAKHFIKIPLEKHASGVKYFYLINLY